MENAVMDWDNDQITKEKILRELRFVTQEMRDSIDRDMEENANRDQMAILDGGRRTLYFIMILSTIAQTFHLVASREPSWWDLILVTAPNLLALILLMVFGKKSLNVKKKMRVWSGGLGGLEYLLMPVLVFLGANLFYLSIMQVIVERK